MARVSSADSTPAAPSASAHARLPVTSSSKSARSKPKEMPKSKAAGSGAVSNRPDQSVTLGSPVPAPCSQVPLRSFMRTTPCEPRLQRRVQDDAGAGPRRASTRPTPCWPAMIDRLSISSTSGIGTSLIATGTPRSERNFHECRHVRRRRPATWSGRNRSLIDHPAEEIRVHLERRRVGGDRCLLDGGDVAQLRLDQRDAQRTDERQPATVGDAGLQRRQRIQRARTRRGRRSRAPARRRRPARVRGPAAARRPARRRR